MEICVLSSSLAAKKNIRFAAGPNDCRRFLHEILLCFEHSHFQKSRMSSRCSRLEQAAQNISEHRLPTLDPKMHKNALVSLEEALCRKGLFSCEAAHLFSCFSFSSKTIMKPEFCRLRRIGTQPTEFTAAKLRLPQLVFQLLSSVLQVGLSQEPCIFILVYRGLALVTAVTHGGSLFQVFQSFQSTLAVGVNALGKRPVKP